jgi:hypothetical protein
MPYPLESSSFLWDIQGTPKDKGFTNAVTGRTTTLSDITTTTVFVTDTPRRIIRRGRHYAYRMTSRGKPRGHLAGVLPNASQFRGIVQAKDKYVQKELLEDGEGLSPS